MADEVVLSEPERRGYEANIARAYVYEAFTHFQLWIPIWVIYLQQERGLSLTQITVLDAPFFLTQVIMEVPTGAFADRFGRKTSLFAGSVLLAAAVFVFGIAESYPLIVVSYLLWGVASTLQSGADSALLYDSLKLAGREDEYTKVQGRISALFPAAALLAGLIGAPLAAATSLSTPIVLSAGLAGMGALVALTFKEPPKLTGQLDYLSTAKEGLSIAFRVPAIRYAILFSALAGVSGFTTGIFSQPFLVGHGASIGSLGIIQTPMRIAAIAGSLVAYRVAARMGDWWVFAVSPILLTVAYLGLAGWDSVYAFSLFPLITLTNTMRAPVIIRYINERIPSNQRATVLSVRNLVLAVCVAVAEPIAGVLADQGSLRLAFVFLSVFSAIALTALLALWRRAERREAESQRG